MRPGHRIRDSEIAASLGVSRTPVREALLRLSRDGVLESDLGRGFRLPSLDPQEIEQTGQILGALEALALELTPAFPPDRLQRLSAIDRQLEQTRGDVGRCIDLEDEWHRVLLEGCPNHRLLALTQQLRQVSRRYLAAYLRESSRIALSTLPHQKIIDALGQDDPELARRTFGRQWQRSIEELKTWAAGAGTSAETGMAGK